MAEPLWTGRTLAEAIGAAPPRDDMAIGGVSIDSRSLRTDDAFFAIRGDRLNGHDYVVAAFKLGAACAVVEEGFDEIDDPRLIRVPDTLEALNALGRAARARSRATVIAVTGSVGKTGTKEALRLALSAVGTVHASEKSYNNHWGVPLSLANLSRWSRFGVFEVGMNHSGEITPLTQLIQPHIAIVTTIEPVHLGFFKSVEEIAEAKAEIFTGLEPDGVAVLNQDNPHFGLLRTRAEAAGARVVAFGATPDADARLLTVVLSPEGSEVDAEIAGDRIRYRVGAPGAHIVHNTLAVLAAASAAGCDIAPAAGALQRLKAPKGRGEQAIFVHDGGRVALIDESYNANPASMRAALSLLGQMHRTEFPRRIAVLGDMLELGKAAPDLHRDLAPLVEAAGVDVVFACGEEMERLFEVLPEGRRGGYAPRSKELITPLLGALRPGDAVMVKGSLGSRMGMVVDALRAHFGAPEGS